MAWLSYFVKPYHAGIAIQGKNVRTYIRAKLTGGVYFFTVNLAERSNNDLLITNIDVLREAFRPTKQHHP